MTGSYWPGDSLSSLLELHIQNYEEDRERHWSDDESTLRLLTFVDAVAQSVVASTDDLVLDISEELELIPWDQVPRMIEAIELSSEVKAKAEILMAWRFATSTDAMATRCLELARVVLRERPSERVLRFLRRVGRCYVAGFLPEGTVMCRGVVENAVNEAVVRWVPSLPDDKMRTKLDALLAGGHITSTGHSEASLVWLRGNTAVHKDPDAVGEVLETVSCTLRVLAQLQASGSGAG